MLLHRLLELLMDRGIGVLNLVDLLLLLDGPVKDVVVLEAFANEQVPE